ncbi:ABC transporter permease [Apibacter adventoris]|uniref:ABC transporter ATP-binding protein n=1 Tax=Apibacter adventoris TaxID=1679466 RepID=A0A2S8AFK1_9FLAO|nr:ABC transporter permease [Apibacter adventoris]PQL94896.1 ABC transporter ATP-binding protein [Apibacter adventoris]
MFDIDRWQEIFYSIKQNKLRAFLSGFTITLGLFIFIILFGIGNGLQNGFMSQFIRDATNLISIFPGRATEAYKGLQENRNITLKNEDLNLIKKVYNKELEYKTSVISTSDTVRYGMETGKYPIQGIFPEKQYIEKIVMISGRFISKNDMNNDQKFAAIGRLIEKDLFKNGNALGKYISIGGINYKIIGVFSDSGGDREERIIYVPITTLQLAKKNSDTINQIDLSYNSSMNPQQAIKLGKNIEMNLRSKLKISPSDKSGLYVRNNAENMGDTFAFFAVISFLVIFIGFGTIMAGIIGISNIMVYIVKERTKEIGVRKALGAKPSNIIGLILHESIFITVISGILGVLLGILTLYLIGDHLSDYFIVDPSVSWTLILFATFCLIIFGSIAGFIPARRAAKIKPIEALRAD